MAIVRRTSRRMKYGIACVVALAVLVVAAPAALAVTLYGVSAGLLVRFDSATPGTVTSVPITGLLAGQSPRAIDCQPTNGQLYIAAQNVFAPQTLSIYSINATTGAATLVTPTGVTLAGTNIGLDFDPTTGLLHVTTELGEHLVVNTATGAITPGMVLAGQGAGTAYSNNVVGAASTTLYALQGSTDTLATVNPLTGVITTVGPLGVDILGTPGFDIANNGSAYAALQVTSLTGENLFTINLATGAATLVGAIGVSVGTDIQGLTAVCGPSAVQLRSFTAATTRRGVVLRWRTASEVGVLGFNVYREQRGQRVKLNRTLIASRGSAASGRVYTFRDRRPAAKAARYWLQTVQLDGSRTWQRAARPT